MLIIMCGPDRVGKTEISKALARQLGWPYFKNETEASFFKHNKFLDALHYDQSYFVQLCEQLYRQNNELDLILDRGYPCEYAYAHHFKRKTDDEFIWQLDKRFSKINTLVVVCYKVENKIKDDLVDVSDYAGILSKYEEFAQHSFCSVFFLNTTSCDLNEELNTLKSFIQLHEVRKMTEICNFCTRLIKNNLEVWGPTAHPLRSAGHGIDYAFVGIAPGRGSMKLKDKADALKEAFKLFSGEVLHEAIDELGIMKQSYITNVIKCATPINQKFAQDEIVKCTSSHLFEELRVIRQHIFLMGNQAQNDFFKSNLTDDNTIMNMTSKIVHPSYILRSVGSNKKKWKHSTEYMHFVESIASQL